MYPSGAFRSLHCLIYKVHVPEWNIRYFSTPLSLCQHLFSTFSSSFRYLLPLSGLPLPRVRPSFQPIRTYSRPPRRTAAIILPFIRFVKSFFPSPPISEGLDRRVPDSLINIPLPATLVNYFFPLFPPFFSLFRKCTKPPSHPTGKGAICTKHPIWAAHQSHRRHTCRSSSAVGHTPSRDTQSVR